MLRQEEETKFHLENDETLSEVAYIYIYKLTYFNATHYFNNRIKCYYR